jgi:hypothetical protein
MLHFLGRRIGFAKGTSLAMVDKDNAGRFSSRKFSLQLWGVEEKNN